MNKTKQRVIDFLKEHSLLHDEIDTQKVLNLLLRDMKNGLEAKNSSLKMIPTYIQAGTAIPTGKPVIVLDAGGTHLRIAHIHFDKDLKAHIDSFKQHPMPGTQGKVNKERFFEQLAEYVDPIIDISERIGFCFSYPTEILPSKDGRLLFFSKEIEAQGIEGELIGENLLKALARKGNNKRKHIVILNDTVATMLAARAQSSKQSYGAYFGFILGTGLNCCYSEKNSLITKAKKLDPAQNQIINTEAGGFDKCPRGDIDKKLDQDTDNPGLHVFEKMISGAYFGELCRRVIISAAGYNLFSEHSINKLSAPGSLGTKQVNEFLHTPYGENTLARCMSGQAEDSAALYYLLDSLVERSAKLVAVILSGMILKNPPPENPCAPVCISAEGSTFFKLKNFKTRVECYLRQALQKQHNLYFEFVQIENAPLIGAAIAGLTN